MNSWHAKVVAITGTIGSGKSTVIEQLKRRGVFVVSADDLAREVVAPGSVGLQQVVDKFGACVLSPAGELDRKALAKIVFDQPTKRHELEAILHPLIAARGKEIFDQAISSGEKKLVYEVPLLFEAGLNKAGFKKIVVVSASESACIDRARKRDKLSADEAKKRLLSQLPVEQKIKGADLVIDNSGSLAELEQEVDKLYRIL